MRENGLAWVLRELAGDRQAKANAEDAMYVDAPASSTQVLKSATLAHGSVVQPKKTVDLEQQDEDAARGFKRAKKGYEEPIHVPAPKEKPVAGGAHYRYSTMGAGGLPGMKTSKLHPVAFRTDDRRQGHLERRARDPNVPDILRPLLMYFPVVDVSKCILFVLDLVLDSAHPVT
ncbi:hypothetical protein FA95DRAFT_583520 [Auriscalpium vulgare]|uniref:Uncharacterized protein n=1 Tax=Auriscalpium vulgare TaxID=40419 RepID=A0ACB8RE66_9AGAM|nr:hypothetical protein FA95DRAFT_583520 [Auriscalpium vulgare]